MKAEERILGAALMRKTALLTLLETIPDEEAFTSESRRAYFKAIRELFSEGREVDTINTSERATKWLKIPSFEIEADLMRMAAEIDLGYKDQDYAEGILNAYEKRKINLLASKMQAKAKEESADAREIVGEAFKDLEAVVKVIRDEKTLEEQAQEVKEQMEQMSAGVTVTGLKTGLDKLDQTLGGLQPGQLITIAGRPGMGKSILALNIATENSRQREVLFFSREMTSSELLKRVMAAREGFNMSIFTNPLPPEGLRFFNEQLDTWVQENSLIINEKDSTLSQMLYTIKRKASRGTLGLVVVDYLQLLQYKGNQTDFLNQATRSLKQVAKDLDIPVIILSQLNREVENRPNKLPQLSDLKQSGSIEEDSNVVVFVYRPEYYGLDTFPDGEQAEGKAWAIVAKNRNGRTGKAVLGFDGYRAKFRNYEEQPTNQVF